jgi:prepilin peptidase CpaA
MLTIVHQFSLLGFAALLLAAAISDIRSRRIPNLLVLGIIVLYPLFVLTAPQAVDWKSGLITFGVVLAAGFILSSAFRFMGAGDAKLLSAAALWAGGKLILTFLMITAASGGLLAGFMLVRRYIKSRARFAAPVLADAALGADAGVTISNMTMAGVASPAATSSNTSTPEIGSNGGEDESTGSKDRFPMVLPYGAAIAIGGLAIAALLQMRG